MLEKGKKMNIPVYRGLKLGTENGYVEGFLYSRKWDGETRTEYYISYESLEWEIDPTTLSIHFEDMLDSQGNKIFASLSEDGKGGDIMKDDEYYGIAKYKDSRFVVEYENVEECLYEGNFESIGIQE